MTFYEFEIPSTACPQYEPLLEEYIEGQIGERDRSIILSHLIDCGNCREALDAASGSQNLFRAAEPTIAPVPQFSRLVMAHVSAHEAASAEQKASFWRPVVALGWRFAATAAVVLVLLLTYDVVGKQQSANGVAVAGQTEVPGIFTPDPVATPSTRDDILALVAESYSGNNR